mmetsp:Transcript_21412/g.50991  ORF Transcript_21412/g.50991 Transcript_21412/m.50991 type:complete len:137 (-) Transcript_21412:173-583(-)
MESSEVVQAVGSGRELPVVLRRRMPVRQQPRRTLRGVRGEKDGQTLSRPVVGTLPRAVHRKMLLKQTNNNDNKKSPGRSVGRLVGGSREPLEKDRIRTREKKRNGTKWNGRDGSVWIAVTEGGRRRRRRREVGRRL